MSCPMKVALGTINLWARKGINCLFYNLNTGMLPKMEIKGDLKGDEARGGELKV